MHVMPDCLHIKKNACMSTEKTKSQPRTCVPVGFNQKGGGGEELNYS